MFPYKVLVERQDFLKCNIIRLRDRIHKSDNNENIELLKNELTETKELLSIVENELYNFIKKNTNK